MHSGYQVTVSYGNNYAKSNCALLSRWVTGEPLPSPNFPKRKIKKCVCQGKWKKKKISYYQITLESIRLSMTVFALYKCLLGLIGSVMPPITWIFIALLGSYRTREPTVNPVFRSVTKSHQSDLSTSYQLVIPTHLITGINIYQILCLSAVSIEWESTYINIS